MKSLKNTHNTYMVAKVHVYIWLHTASTKSTAWNKTSPFHISTSSRLSLAGAFRNDNVAACSTALRNATDENESGAYVTVPCPFKVTQHSSTGDWQKF